MDLGETQESAFLTHSHVLLKPLARKPHFKNHWDSRSTEKEELGAGVSWNTGEYKHLPSCFVSAKSRVSNNGRFPGMVLLLFPQQTIVPSTVQLPHGNESVLFNFQTIVD